MPPATIVIDVDPVILRLGHLALSWYGLATVLAIGAALFVGQREVRRRNLPEDAFWGIAPWAVAGGLVGARAFHVIDDWPAYSGNPLLSLADAVAPGIVLGQAIGRLGCLVTGDTVGRETSLPWGISYLNSDSMAPARGVSFQPVFAYEALWDLAAFGLLWMLRKRIKRPGGLFATYLALYAAGKFAVSFLREERRWLWDLQEAHFVALLLAGISIALWVRVLVGRPQPGTEAAT